MPRPLPLLLQLLQQQGDRHAIDLHAALGGLKRYQLAERVPPARPPLRVFAQAGSARLLQSRAWKEGRQHVVIIPSIVNGPEILDLSDDYSLLDALSSRYNVLLLDWGEVTANRAQQDIDYLITECLVPLTAKVGRPQHLVGYCLGGLFALALAHMQPSLSLTLLACPWNFAAYPADHRKGLIELWRKQEVACRNLGVLPFELLQSGFWLLEPERVAAKYSAADGMGDESFQRFVRVEDWANGGQPLMLGAARDLMDRLMADNVTGEGCWTVSGEAIDGPPTGLPCLSVRSTSDKIVPHEVSAAFGDVLDVASGHVGMIVGSHRRERLWDPLLQWLERA